MESRLFSVLFAALIVGSDAAAQFEGTLDLTPPGCDAIGQCVLKTPLRFSDSAKVVWEARAGLSTDGASIPGIFQPFIGKPFDTAFIKAAIIHDHYCDRQVRPWRQTHKIFYEGLIDQGVPEAKAKTMYFAVYMGGPKWIKLMPGKNCGQNCVNNFKSTSGIQGVYARKADYSAPDLEAAVQSIASALEANPTEFSLPDLEARAIQLRPSDFFYKRGDSTEASEIGVFE